MTTATRDAARAIEHQGRYAGPVTRLLAYLVDLGIASSTFAATLALITAAIDVATPWSIDLGKESPLVMASYLGWFGMYLGNGWLLRSKSPGMALLGLRIVRADGSELDHQHALVRLAAFPLGFLTLGFGFLGIIFGRSRQAIYDRVADTAVVYGWDAEAAKLRALAKVRHEGTAPWQDRSAEPT